MSESNSSTVVVNEFTRQLADVLEERAKKKNNDNFVYKYLFEGENFEFNDEKAVAEALTVLRLPFDKKIAVVYLLAITHVINKEYTTYTTYTSRSTRYEPAETLDVEIGIDQTEKAFSFGIYELLNKQTNVRIIVSIEKGGWSDPPTMKMIARTTPEGVKNEAEVFNKFVHDELERTDIYRNKTIAFQIVQGSLSPKFIKTLAVKRDEVILANEVWEQVDANILNVFIQNAKYKAAGIPTKRGIILEGPPGNGKSMLVKHVETVLNGLVTFMYITDGVALSGPLIAQIFAMAREYSPSVVIFEDVDGIGSSRSYGSDGLTSELLSQLDGLEELTDFVIVATTNYPDKIDEALKNRPSRFDRRIKITLPEDGYRIKLMSKYLKDKGHDGFSDEELQKIAPDLKNFSGAHLQELIITAKMNALQADVELDIEHIKAAIGFLKLNYYDSKIGKDSGMRAGFRLGPPVSSPTYPELKPVEEKSDDDDFILDDDF